MSADTGGHQILTAVADDQFLEQGMTTRVVVMASQVGPGTVELYNETAGVVVPSINQGAGGRVICAPFQISAGTYTYQPRVNDNGTVTVTGQSIPITWLPSVGHGSADQKNSTSKEYLSTDEYACNAKFTVTGATSTTPSITEYLGNYGIGDSYFNAEVFAETFSGTILTKPCSTCTPGWVGLGIGTVDSYTWDPPINGSPMRFQITGYAIPSVNGSPDNSLRAKAYAPTWFSNCPANPYGIPDSATLGELWTLTGLPATTQIWVLYTDINNYHPQWTTGYTNSSGEIRIPLTRMGGMQINISTIATAYVNVGQ